jgi:ribosomal protein S18 acetylase RimI-like enzyme
MIAIEQAASEEHMQQARELFIEYFNFLHVLLDSAVSDLNTIHSLQGYEAELAGLFDQYVPPEGRLLLAYDNAEIAGCVVLCKISEGVCEVKRLWIKPPYRGKKISRALVETLVEEARKIGYRAIILSTVPAMKEAISLYSSLGFEFTENFYTNPEEAIADQMFMKMDLIH